MTLTDTLHNKQYMMPLLPLKRKHSEIESAFRFDETLEEPPFKKFRAATLPIVQQQQVSAQQQSRKRKRFQDLDDDDEEMPMAKKLKSHQNTTTTTTMPTAFRDTIDVQNFEYRRRMQHKFNQFKMQQLQIPEQANNFLPSVQSVSYSDVNKMLHELHLERTKTRMQM